MTVRFRWADYLELAKQLSACAPAERLAEASYRSAVSRAYYSVFVPAHNYLQKKGRPVPTNTSTHKFVIDELRGSADSAWQAIGTQLNELRHYRITADYKDTVHNVAWLAWVASLAVELAEKTAKLIAGLR